MHNHIAVRLMSFVLEHRPHTRWGSEPMNYRREFEFEEELYVVEFDKGGYDFVLHEPLFVEVLSGRIRGQVTEPIDGLLPRFDREVGAYVMPDGQWVSVDRFGNMTPRLKPFDFDAPLEAPEPTDGSVVASTVDATPASSETGMPKAAPAAIPVGVVPVPVTPTPALP
jgi:hypothetical protein